jgi:hypothetical protein
MKNIAFALVLLCSPDLTRADDFGSKECSMVSDSCFCYDLDALDRIATEIVSCQLVRVQAEEYKALADSMIRPWYMEKEWVIGGVAVGFSFGAVLGYYLGSSR